MNHKKVILWEKENWNCYYVFCVKTVISALMKRKTHILEIPSQKNASPVSLDLCYVNYGPFRHRNRNNLEKIAKNQVVVSSYSVWWQRLISQRNICLTSWFRILTVVFTLSATTRCYTFMRNLLHLYVSEYAIILTNFQKVFAAQYFNSLCLHETVWKISQVSHIRYLH